MNKRINILSQKYISAIIAVVLSFSVYSFIQKSADFSCYVFQNDSTGNVAVIHQGDDVADGSHTGLPFENEDNEEREFDEDSENDTWEFGSGFIGIFHASEEHNLLEARRPEICRAENLSLKSSIPLYILFHSWKAYPA